uniref:Uncharacterized protein n=1 Tax=Gopherus evgoodei TaxID=1825980 RepID=A0A8C4VJA1_9SAUR
PMPGHPVSPMIHHRCPSFGDAMVHHRSHWPQCIMRAVVQCGNLCSLLTGLASIKLLSMLL